MTISLSKIEPYLSQPLGPSNGGNITPVHDLIAASIAEWNQLIEQTAEQARHAGELTPDTDTAQLAFELLAYLERANAISVLHNDHTAYTKAMTAVQHRLHTARHAATTDPG